uniref:Uncharacterized protein n=1 Tax=Setaria viridis TaxID=4556 RepID=A0A4U6US23_SETVI|nr:hypothetical protein SEVIR_4G007701v2 [Setaria viridis]
MHPGLVLLIMLLWFMLSAVAWRSPPSSRLETSLANQKTCKASYQHQRYVFVVVHPLG